MNLQQRTPAWHVARRGKLTASNLGAALGQVSYVSRAAAYRRAIGLEKFTGNEATEWGNQNESNGIVDYQTVTGNVVCATGLHVHSAYTWLAGSPDGLIGEEGMIEVKCPFYWRRDGSGRLHKKVPVHYFMQVNALLEICDRQWCDYVCWSPEGMVIYRISRNPTIFDFLMTYYSQFYAAMQLNSSGPPPLSRADKLRIGEELEAALTTSVDYSFYRSADPSFPPPEIEIESDDDDEMIKRQKII